VTPAGRRRAGALGIDGGRLWTGSAGAGGRAVSLAGHLILPGLVNAHDHLHLNVFPRTRFRRRYEHSADWVKDMAEAIERPELAALRAVPAESRAWHGALKNALAGATTVVHHDPWLEVFARPDFPVTVVPRLGWAHSLDLAGSYGPAVAASFAATPAGRPWFIHLAEGTDVRAGAEVGRLQAIGCLAARTRLVHAVGLRAEDRERVREAGAALVWCPSSNGFLLGRPADPSWLTPAGRVALGTDARLTGERDLLDELRFAAATGLAAPAELLAMVTAGGAALCGAPPAGRLAEGAPADLVVLRDDGRPPAVQLLAARRADLRLVLVRGRPVIGDPDLAVIFDLCDLPAVWVRLDGRPKLLAEAALAGLVHSGLAEPGLELPRPRRREDRGARPAAARAMSRA
jgi:cytosine/adenosine deaminase-related metal-dependent hydrolase